MGAPRSTWVNDCKDLIGAIYGGVIGGGGGGRWGPIMGITMGAFECLS